MLNQRQSVIWFENPLLLGHSSTVVSGFTHITLKRMLRDLASSYTCHKSVSNDDMRNAYNLKDQAQMNTKNGISWQDWRIQKLTHNLSVFPTFLWSPYWNSCCITIIKVTHWCFFLKRDFYMQQKNFSMRLRFLEREEKREKNGEESKSHLSGLYVRFHWTKKLGLLSLGPTD